jgi:hypothetical protein
MTRRACAHIGMFTAAALSVEQYEVDRDFETASVWR